MSEEAPLIKNPAAVYWRIGRVVNIAGGVSAIIALVGALVVAGVFVATVGTETEIPIRGMQLPLVVISVFGGAYLLISLGRREWRFFIGVLFSVTALLWLVCGIYWAVADPYKISQNEVRIMQNGVILVHGEGPVARGFFSPRSVPLSVRSSMNVEYTPQKGWKGREVTATLEVFLKPPRNTSVEEGLEEAKARIRDAIKAQSRKLLEKAGDVNPGRILRVEASPWVNKVVVQEIFATYTTNEGAS